MAFSLLNPVKIIHNFYFSIPLQAILTDPTFSNICRTHLSKEWSNEYKEDIIEE